MRLFACEKRSFCFSFLVSSAFFFLKIHQNLLAILNNIYDVVFFEINLISLIIIIVIIMLDLCALIFKFLSKLFGNENFDFSVFENFAELPRELSLL